jgi:hypothetical protein
LDPKYIQGFVEGCLERIGEDDPEDEALFRDLWEDEGERETVLQILKAECEILSGWPEDNFPHITKTTTRVLRRVMLTHWRVSLCR